MTQAYQDSGVTSIRTHDLYGPLDMATLYPNQEADPSDEASYDFTNSDEFYQAILDGGFVPYFRLGDSYSNNEFYPEANPREPTNKANWIEAAVFVIEHYNDPALWGEAPLEYVEIWNEPDNEIFWDGTNENFYAFFADAANRLNNEFPDLKIGGPGFIPGGFLSPTGLDYTEAFVEYMAANAVELDFLSWHMYSNDPEEYSEAAAYYRDLLDSNGYTAIESHISEWNTESKDLSESEAEELRVQARGAAILTAAWISLQNADVTQAHFYRGYDPTDDLGTFYGMIYGDNLRKRASYAFGFWQELVNHEQKLSLTHSVTDLHTLAGQNSAGEIVLLLANLGESDVDLQIAFASRQTIADFSRVTQATIDDSADSPLEQNLDDLEISIASGTVQLVHLTP